MLTWKSRGLAILLSGILAASMPASVFAVDAENAQAPVEKQEKSLLETVIDLEEEGYYIRLEEEKEIYEYTGEEIKPSVKLMYKDENGEEQEAELKEDTDYTVEYENNIEDSSKSDLKPTVIVSGIEKGGVGYTGTLEKEFEIIKSEEKGPNTGEQAEEDDKKMEVKSGGEESEPVSINHSMVTLSSKLFNYDGKVKCPGVTVKHGTNVLVKGKDYTVQYKNNINIGTATVVVSGNGNYEGSTSVNYQIQMGSTKLTSTSSYSVIKLKWAKVPGANRYQIYRSTSATAGFKRIKTISSGSTTSYSDKNTKFNKTYYYKIRAYRTENGKTYYGQWSTVKSQKKRLSTPSISSTKSGYTSITIKWKKVSKATGYIVYRSTSENGKYKRVKTFRKGTSISFKDTNRTSGKSYYYKVRAFRKANGKTYMSLTSGAKRKTTKKLDGNWRYVNGYKLFYDKKGKLVKDVSSIIGKQSSYVIKVNKKKNCVTVYAKDGKRGYIIPVKAFVCSAGNATPIMTARTPAKYRWRALMGNCYGQWSTRIKSGYLFHSVMYGRTKNTTLSVSAYNKLGQTASHGCIRLKAADAKWIYDNCKLKTKVIIYNSSNPGPLGKPSAVKLPSWHKWDPTDPTAQYKCRQRGCH